MEIMTWQTTDTFYQGPQKGAEMKFPGMFLAVVAVEVLGKGQFGGTARRERQLA